MPDGSAPPLTHRDLVVLGWRFLRAGKNRCTVAVTEPVTAACCSPDVIGWGYRGSIHIVEAKRTRSDFRRDASKVSHRGDGIPGDYRWYVAPSGLILPTELPEGWGLAEVSIAPDGGHRIRSRVAAPPIVMSERGRRESWIITASVLRRLADGGKICPETGRISSWEEIQASRQAQP